MHSFLIRTSAHNKLVDVSLLQPKNYVIKHNTKACQIYTGRFCAADLVRDIGNQSCGHKAPLSGSLPFIYSTRLVIIVISLVFGNSILNIANRVLKCDKVLSIEARFQVRAQVSINFITKYIEGAKALSLVVPRTNNTHFFKLRLICILDESAYECQAILTSQPAVGNASSSEAKMHCSHYEFVHFL